MRRSKYEHCIQRIFKFGNGDIDCTEWRATMGDLSRALSDSAAPYIASLLRGEIEREYQSMQDGRVDYAMSVARISIVVRFKLDPDRASFLANAITKSIGPSIPLKEAAEVWHKDIRIWQNERDKLTLRNLKLTNRQNEGKGRAFSIFAIDRYRTIPGLHELVGSR